MIKKVAFVDENENLMCYEADSENLSQILTSMEEIISTTCEEEKELFAANMTFIYTDSKGNNHAEGNAYGTTSAKAELMVNELVNISQETKDPVRFICAVNDRALAIVRGLRTKKTAGGLIVPGK